MRRRDFLKAVTAGAAAATIPQWGCRGAGKPVGSGKQPNFLIIYADDLGYNDLGCYGAQDAAIKTPNINRMAAEGIRFTDWFSSCNVCAPSRASLLTGRYPSRCGMPVCANDSGRFKDWSQNIGLQQSEITIAELLRPLGYATAWYGKSHLGHDPKFLPRRHGFDEYYGSLYNFPVGGGREILEGDEVVERDVRFEQIHQRLTDRSLAFMKKSSKQGRPFFIYLAHYLVHGPWVPNRRFATDEQWASYRQLKGKMNPKVLPAMVRELDWHVGEVLKALKENGLDDNTFVVFISDNGPWLPAGSAWPLRGSKFNTFEGGHRVPAIARFPGRIPPEQVCDKLCSTMDILPTIAALAGATLPADRVIDGLNIWPVMQGQADAKAHDVLYYYNGVMLEVVREGKWKLHLPRELQRKVYWSKNKRVGGLLSLKKPVLFDLAGDVGETKDVAEKYPQVVKRLLARAEQARAELGDWNRMGSDQKKLLNYTGDPNNPVRIPKKAKPRTLQRQGH